LNGKFASDSHPLARRANVQHVALAADRHWLAKVNLELLCLRACSACACAAINRKLLALKQFALHYLLLLNANARLALALFQRVVNASQVDYVVAACGYDVNRLLRAELVRMLNYEIAVARCSSALLANVRLKQGVEHCSKKQENKYSKQDLAHAHKHVRGLTSFVHDKKPFKIGYKCFYGASQQW
jgi:hypothetical protein